MATDSHIAIIILAAGMSRRLGFPKQLCRRQGRTLLEHTVLCAHSVAKAQICVVLGAQEQRCKALLANDSKLLILSHSNYARGIGTSIQRAHEVLQQMDVPWQGYLFCVCDQFLLEPEVLCAIASAAREEHGEQWVAAAYAESWGTPLYMPASCFPLLSELTEDKGVKSLAQRKGIQPILVPFALGIHDLDSADDLEVWDIQAPLEF